MLKMFIADYGEQSSGPEKSIVFAESVEEAKGCVLRVRPKDEEIKFVEDTPKDFYETGCGFIECHVREVEIRAGIVYTGHYCC